MQGWVLDLGLQIIAFLLFIGFGLGIWIGLRRLKRARQLTFFEFRRKQLAQCWRVIFTGLALGFGGFLVQTAVRRAFGIESPASHPATATLASTSTRTVMPTVTKTPTPAITSTPGPTSTPSIPQEIVALFQESVTPHPDAAFGPIHVWTQVIYPPPVADQAFEDHAGTLYGIFSYDHVYNGVRWTAIWKCDGEMVCVDTKPWDGEQGGWGFTDCALETWPQGRYEIQMFLGEEWKASSWFVVLGSPPTP